MPISNPPVQHAEAVSNAAAFSSGNTAGNFLAALIQVSSAVTAVTDTAGNTWVKACGVANAGNALYAEIWYVENCAAGANTVTVANGFGASFCHVGVAEYSGLATSSGLDQTSTADNGTAGGSAADSGSTATTTLADELLLGLVANESAETIVWDAPWTERYDDASGGASRAMSWADQVVSATATYKASGTLSGAGAGWQALIATFKAAAGAAAGVRNEIVSLNQAVMAAVY